MTCCNFYVYPLLLSLLAILVPPRLVAAADIHVLAHALEGRLAQLRQGTVRYEYYEFKCPPDVFRKIRDSFDQNDVGVSNGGRNNRLRALLHGPSIERVTAYRGTMYFTAKGKQWRLVKKNIRGYGLSAEDLEHLAAKRFKRVPGKRVKVILNVDEDVSYDGKTLLRLENNKTLIKSGLTPGLNYPTIRTLDISLAPWNEALENAPLANQTITVKAQGSMWSVSYTDRPIRGPVSDEVGEFNAARGFAPVRIYGTTNNKVTSETLFHCHRARGNEYVVGSILAWSYPVAKQTKIRCEVYLVTSWSNKVTEKDLKVKLPKKYLLIDERFGGASPIFRIIHGNSSTRPAGVAGGRRDR